MRSFLLLARAAARLRLTSLLSLPSSLGRVRRVGRPRGRPGALRLGPNRQPAQQRDDGRPSLCPGRRHLALGAFLFVLPGRSDARADCPDGTLLSSRARWSVAISPSGQDARPRLTALAASAPYLSRLCHICGGLTFTRSTRRPRPRSTPSGSHRRNLPSRTLVWTSSSTLSPASAPVEQTHNRHSRPACFFLPVWLCRSISWPLDSDGERGWVSDALALRRTVTRVIPSGIGVLVMRILFSFASQDASLASASAFSRSGLVATDP
jgi:hypothetical protein